MCKMIFIGTSEELIEIPWNDEKPAFYLQKPLADEKAVLDKFTKPHVYFVGTKRGCSCDFISYSNTSDEDFEFERSAFAQILGTQTKAGNDVEIYCCWAENYTSPIEEKSLKVYTNNLNDFYIDENEMITYTSKS